MASIQEIVARRAPVASLPQASPNPNVGVGLISDAGSAGFRQLGQVRGISLDTATGFGQAMATDAQTVGMVGQAVGQIATAVDELNEANEKARLVSAGKLASKKIEEWNSISDETQREEFRVKQVEPALARINSQRKGLINIANDTRNALVSEMGILSNAHMANTAKSNGYMELAKLRIELDNAKDLGEGDVLAERYLSLSTSLITSGTLDPKEAYLLGKDTQAILKISKENRLTSEYQRLIQNVPDNEINNVIEKLQKEGKGYVFSEDSEFRVLEKALDKSPLFRAKLLEDERTRRLKGLKAIVEEGEALESLAFQEERDQLENVKSSIRAKINAYEGGNVGRYTQELLNEYKGFSSKFRTKLRIDADKAINIRTTLRNLNLKEFIPKGQNILFAYLDKSGNANILQSYSEAQDKRKFLDDYLRSEESASFRDLLTEHGISLESAEFAFLRIYNDPISKASVTGFNTPRETITKNFLSKAKNIVEKNVVLNSMGKIDSKLIPNIMGRIQEEVTRLREANPNIADLKGALADLQKRFDANPRAVLELSSKESVVREKLSGEPLDLEDIDKKLAALPKEKVEFVDANMRKMINAEMISNPKLTEKVATGKVSNPQHLFSQLGNAVLKNPNVPKAKKAEMIKMAVTSAQKIHQVEVEKVEALRGKPQEISDVFPEGVRTPEQMQQFMNTHTQAEGFPLKKRDIPDVPEVAPKENQENMFMGFARHLGKLLTGNADFELPDLDDIGKGLGSRDSRIDRQAAAAKAMEFDGKERQWNNDTQSWEPLEKTTTQAPIPNDANPTTMRFRTTPNVKVKSLAPSKQSILKEIKSIDSKGNPSESELSRRNFLVSQFSQLEKTDKATKYAGEKAFNKLKGDLGKQGINLPDDLLGYMEKLSKDEGYSSKAYVDTKGILTGGLGQTGKYLGTFDNLGNVDLTGAVEALQDKISRIKGNENIGDLFSKLSNSKDNASVDLRENMVSSFYRGGLSGSKNTMALLGSAFIAEESKDIIGAKQLYKEAAKEFLNNEEYRRKSTSSGVKKRMKRLSDAIKKYSDSLKGKK